LVLTTALGEVTLGNPRPLIKTMIEVPELGSYRFLELGLDADFSSTLEFVGLVFDEQLYGVSFKGSSGTFGYGVSYHSVDQFDFDFLEIAATYQLGRTRFQAGFEATNLFGGSGEKFLIGATYEEDRWSAGVLLT